MVQSYATPDTVEMASKPTHVGVDPRRESRSRWLWIAFILCFFGLQALLWTSALTMVRKHPIRPVGIHQSDRHHQQETAVADTGKEG